MYLKRLFSRIIRGLYFFPKTIYINFRVLPFNKAIKFPIIIMNSCSLQGLNKNNFKINSEIKTAMIRIGAEKTAKRGVPSWKKSFLIVSKNGEIIFNGNASIGQGTSICAKGGKIIFGKKFSCNVNCFIYSQNKIIFGDDVLIGWNINIRDNDGHPIYDQNKNLVNPDKEIHIGDHVWIASYVDILKGVNLAVGTIVGTRSLVTKSNSISNAIIAGFPAKVIKENVFWKHE